MDIDPWELKEYFTITQAACLLCGIEPPLDDYAGLYDFDYERPTGQEWENFEVIHHLLEESFNSRGYIAHVPKISRYELREFVINKGLPRPPRLFPEDRPKESELQQTRFSSIITAILGPKKQDTSHIKEVPSPKNESSFEHLPEVQDEPAQPCNPIAANEEIARIIGTSEYLTLREAAFWICKKQPTDCIVDDDVRLILDWLKYATEHHVLKAWYKDYCNLDHSGVGEFGSALMMRRASQQMSWYFREKKGQNDFRFRPVTPIEIPGKDPNEVYIEILNLRVYLERLLDWLSGKGFSKCPVKDFEYATVPRPYFSLEDFRQNLSRYDKYLNEYAKENLSFSRQAWIPVIEDAISRLSKQQPESEAKEVSTEQPEVEAEDKQEISQEKKSVFSHSPDYRSVNLQGQPYSLTSKLAQVVEILHVNYEQKTPEVSESWLLNRIDSTQSRLRDVFKGPMEKVFKAIVVRGQRKDTYRLNI